MSNKKPLMSIITVTKDSELYIADAIESVLHQNYDNYEYIIIDGVSTDSTVEILRRYEPRFIGKMHWISEVDTGIYNAFNKGLKMAGGDVIGILNSDDYYEKNIFKDVVDRIADYDMLHGRMRFVDCERNPIKVYKHKKGILSKFVSTPFNHPTMFVKKEVYYCLGPFDESFPVAADYDFMLRFYRSRYCDYYFDRVITNLRTTGITSSAEVVVNPEEIAAVLKKNGVPRMFVWGFIKFRFFRASVAKVVSKNPMILALVRKIIPYQANKTD